MTIRAGLIRVLVVDEHPAVRAGVRTLLEDERDLEPVATATDRAEAVQAAAIEHPDVAVVGYHLPGPDGLAVARSLKRLERPPSVILYSAYADPALQLAGLVGGVDAVLSKSVLGRELCHVIRALADRRPPPPAPVSPAALQAAAARLDPADLPILGMLLHGTPAAEIAEVLGISERWLAARRWAMSAQLCDGGAQPAGARAGAPASGARVTAPSEALETSAAYLASTPVRSGESGAR